MRKYFVWLCLVFNLVSCENRKLQRELEEFTARDVVVPSGMRQMAAGQDSIVMSPVAPVARLVVWVDSANCSTCRMQKMFEYAEIVDFSEESGAKFVPVFIFSPPKAKIDEVLQALKYSVLDYHVFIDENQAFPAANPHIPADNRFHTFLLDKNGKVVLVGDPANNPQLWELYKTTITELIENGGVMPDVEKKE